MSQLLALSLYSQFSRCASTLKTFVLRTRVTSMTNKEKAVTATTVHGKKINKTALL